MKKRYAAGLALALVGILSGCGKAETQPADNTISITPVERKTNGPLGRQRMGERGRDVYR